MTTAVDLIQRSIQEAVPAPTPKKVELEEEATQFPSWFVYLLLIAMGGMTLYFIDVYFDKVSEDRIELAEQAKKTQDAMFALQTAEASAHVFTADEIQKKYASFLRWGLIQVLYRDPNAAKRGDAHPTTVLVVFDLERRGSINYLLLRGPLPEGTISN